MSIADGGVQITTMQGGVQTPFQWNPMAYATGCESWQLGSWIGSVLVNSDDSGNLSCEYAVFNAANVQGAFNVVPPGFYGAGIFKSWSSTDVNAGDGANFQTWVTYALTSPPPSPATHRVAMAIVLSGTASELAASASGSQAAIFTQTLETLASFSCLGKNPTTCKNMGSTLWPSVGENMGYCALFDFNTLTFTESIPSSPQATNTLVQLSASVSN
jgi:hypothetical protein